MNPFRKKRKLENGLTFDEMVQRYNLALFESQELRQKQIDLALELDRKRHPKDYIR